MREFEDAGIEGPYTSLKRPNEDAIVYPASARAITVCLLPSNELMYKDLLKERGFTDEQIRDGVYSIIWFNDAEFPMGNCGWQFRDGKKVRHVHASISSQPRVLDLGTNQEQVLDKTITEPIMQLNLLRVVLEMA